jgi:hypothetical protein
MGSPLKLEFEEYTAALVFLRVNFGSRVRHVAKFKESDSSKAAQIVPCFVT